MFFVTAAATVRLAVSCCFQSKHTLWTFSILALGKDCQTTASQSCIVIISHWAAHQIYARTHARTHITKKLSKLHLLMTSSRKMSIIEVITTMYNWRWHRVSLWLNPNVQTSNQNQNSFSPQGASRGLSADLQWVSLGCRLNWFNYPWFIAIWTRHCRGFFHLSPKVL